MIEISRKAYCDMYGPTVGDRVRLGDTSLIAEVEKDLTVHGDEAKFGGGKSLRDGMGQSCKATDKECLDTVITNALIIDSTGIIKADVGIKDGRIAGIGKAGNPDIMNGVDKNMIIGASTEAIAGEGLILTAGGLDTHIHFISPTQVRTALYSGITTMIGGGTGPADGTNATTCTPGEFNIHRMLEASEDLPMNFGYLCKGNSSDITTLEEQIKAGCIGLKIHEDWGSTPDVIDHALTVADMYDVQAAIHTDTLNEGGFVKIPSMLSRAGLSTLITQRVQAADTLLTLSEQQRSRMFSLPQRTLQCLTPQTLLTNIWICSWCVITLTKTYRRTLLLRIQEYVLKLSPQRTFCTIWEYSQ